jgi:hypothetical protein
MKIKPDCCEGGKRALIRIRALYEENPARGGIETGARSLIVKGERQIPAPNILCSLSSGAVERVER